MELPQMEQDKINDNPAQDVPGRWSCPESCLAGYNGCIQEMDDADSELEISPEPVLY